MKDFKYAIVIASDSRSQGDRQDLCIDVIKSSLDQGFTPVYEKIVSDDGDVISKELRYLADELEVDLVITSGGTGLSPRDNTPEATLEVLDKETPGISEAIRLIALEKTPYGMLSRAVSGIRKSTLIVNLPGSPKAVEESLIGIRGPLIHGLEVLLGIQGEHK